MYDILLQLPLFQGLCKNDFTNIIEKVKFHFKKYSYNEKIILQGDECTKLIFLLNGEIVAHTKDDNGLYSLYEIIKAPFAFEPQSLFGMKTQYKSSYNSHIYADTVSIDKTYILKDLNNYEIFRLNYLNYLSNGCQNSRNKLWNIHIGNTKEKIVNFIFVRCIKHEGEKVLKIKMDDFAQLINDTRINVSKTLNEMQEQELVKLSRKEIFIPSFENLISSL